MLPVKFYSFAKATLLISLAMTLLTEAKTTREINSTASQSTQSRAVRSINSTVTCYRLTTFDHRALKLTQAGRVVVEGSTSLSSGTLYDFVMMPLDPYTDSAMLSVEEGIVFIWRTISPTYTLGVWDYYLSATCGDSLKAKPQLPPQKISGDGHFIRMSSADRSTFRYQLYSGSNCYVTIRNTGYVEATQYVTTPPTKINNRFPAYNLLTDLKLHTADCY